MTAIFKREFRAYFHSPIGYICIAVFWAACGWYFYSGALSAATATLRPVFNAEGTISLFVIPLITMRLFSEEKRQRTEQGLLTAPISLWELIAGKYLSALAFYAVHVGIALIDALALAFYADVQWGELFCMLLGMLLMGGAMIGIGMLLSSLTENQIVAAATSFACMLAIGIVPYLPAMISVKWISAIVARLSFSDVFYPFLCGTIELYSVVFFLSVIFLCCFFTVRVFEKRRYA